MEKMYLKQFICIALLSVLILTPFSVAQITIVQTSGTPQIISCEPSYVESFGQADINVRVKNIGDGAGNFRFSYKCGDGEIDYPYVSHRQFSSGEERTEKIEVSGKESETQRCSIFVSDANSFYENEVSCEISLKTKKCNYCYNEGVRCNNERGYLEKCSDNNCEMDIVDYCSDGCSWDKKKAKYSCNEDIEKPNYTPYFITVIIILALIIGWLIINKGKKKK